MEVWAQNLSSALAYAIEARTKEEKDAGNTGESALLAGWKEVKTKVDSGEVTSLTLKG